MGEIGNLSFKGLIESITHSSVSTLMELADFLNSSLRKKHSFDSSLLPSHNK